jgi:hypothetical protein
MELAMSVDLETAGPVTTLFYMEKAHAEAVTILLRLARPLFREVHACINEGRTNPENLATWVFLRDAAQHIMEGGK